jgi:hypothetical protein
MKRRFLIIQLLLFLIILLFPVSSYAKGLNKSSRKVYPIFTNNGEVGSTTVSTFLYEKATKVNSSKVNYTERHETIWHEDNITWSKVKITSGGAKHVKIVDGTTKTVKTFNWSKMDVLHTASQKVSLAKKNKTKCTYSPNTSVKLKIGYGVYADDDIIVKSSTLSLPLKY